MNKVIFSDIDGTCRIEFDTADGVKTVSFEATSSLVNYVRDNGINVPIANCTCE